MYPNQGSPGSWSQQPPNGQYAPPRQQVSCTCAFAGFAKHAKNFDHFHAFCLSRNLLLHFPLHNNIAEMSSIDPSLSSDNAADPNGMAQIPPIQQAVPQQPQGPGQMATMQPQHPDQYRALPPPHMYAYPQQPMPYAPPQPAPRQRTAIACRYCRRRKVRRSRGAFIACAIIDGW